MWGPPLKLMYAFSLFGQLEPPKNVCEFFLISRLTCLLTGVQWDLDSLTLKSLEQKLHKFGTNFGKIVIILFFKCNVWCSNFHWCTRNIEVLFLILIIVTICIYKKWYTNTYCRLRVRWLRDVLDSAETIPGQCSALTHALSPAAKILNSKMFSGHFDILNYPNSFSIKIVWHCIWLLQLKC